MCGFTPVFEKDGYEFVLPYSDMVGEDEFEADKIGWGMAFTNGIIQGYKMKRVVEIDGLVGQEAKLGNSDIYIINKKLE